MAYTIKLLRLSALARGGYPFQANDLTLEEWADLSLVKDALQPQLNCPLMRKK
jgi:hypothetical protein